ncbi:MAG: hypothetical protein J6Y91_06670 [Alphaproteobacteria bacterium]|nr:hypothetical protein [Alphaproteobacteria bacterium]
MNKIALFEKLAELGVTEEYAALYAKLAAIGFKAGDAQAYIDWLRTDPDANRETPVQFAYLEDRGERLFASPDLKSNMLGSIWGIQVEGVFWCRWHIDMMTTIELSNWRDGRLLSTSKLSGEPMTKYERVRMEYFFNCAGSEMLGYFLPSVEDFRKLQPHIKQFSEFLKALEAKGHCIQDWFFDEGYWAYDEKQLKPVVYDLKKGKIKPIKTNEPYALRPVWLPQGV